MKGRAKTALGIDIGERRISVAVVERSERGFRTIAAAMGNLPAGEAGRQRDYGRALAQALRQVGRRARLRGLRAAVAVSADPMVMQLLDAPKHVPANAGEFIRQELRQYVTLSGKDMLSDYCGVGTAEGVQKRLFAVAADAAQIREMVKACGTSGASVEIVEPSVLACARAWWGRERPARRQGDRMMAVLGSRSLTVCLFCKGTLDFVRIRDVPRDATSADSLCTWLAEELRAVMQYGDMRIVRENPERHVTLIVHESAHPPEEIERLLAAEAGMDSVRVAGPCDCFGDEAAAGESAPSQTPSVAAFGAALRLLDAERDNLGVNLLPAEVRQTRLFSRRLLLAANTAALVFLGLLLAIQVLTRAADAVNQRLEQTRISRQLYATPALIAQEKFLDQEMARVQRCVQSLQVDHAGREVDWAAVLNAVGQATPGQACITHLTCGDNRNLSLRGLALTGDAAREFVRNLDGQDLFESVSLARIERRQQDRRNLLEYQIDCVLRMVN